MHRSTLPRTAFLFALVSALICVANSGNRLHASPMTSVFQEQVEANTETADQAHGAKSATDDHVVGSAEGTTHTGILGNIITLCMLVFLQAVLGLDNLLYISLESKRAPADKQRMVRVWGIGLAIFLRIALLFILIKMIKVFRDPWFDTPGAMKDYLEGHFNLHSIIVLVGGVFILYTAMKEVWHMIRLESDEHAEDKPKSIAKVIFWIVLMNVVFSFDSILSAMALTDSLWVMGLAIIVGGVLMIVLADTVANFLKKNRMYEVLGLFILLIVGIMLLSEGGHLAGLKFLGNEVQAMSKATFYFVIGVLIVIEIVQSKYQKKLLAAKAANTTH